MTHSPDRRREAIARIIDPFAFEVFELTDGERGREAVDDAYAKADAILSSDLGEGMGIRSGSIQKAGIKQNISIETKSGIE